MKVKAYKGDNLVGVKIKIPKKYEDEYMGIKGTMILQGVWSAGVWLKKDKDLNSTKIYPLCIDPKEVLNFTVVK